MQISNARPLGEIQGVATANIQNTGDVGSIGNVIPEPFQSDRPSNAKPRKSRKELKGTAKTPNSKKVPGKSTAAPADAKKKKKENNRVARATALRKQFPTMENIPDSITPSQRKKLILRHTQNATGVLQPTHSAINEGPVDAAPVPSTQSAKSKKAENQEKQRKRAALLKQQYPDMKGIPQKVGIGTKKKLVAQYKATSSALSPSVTMPTSSNTVVRNGSSLNDLPRRLVPPAPALGKDPTLQFTLHETSTDYSATSDTKSQKPTTYKMAPLSEERRAEVARNLAAGSNDDPVMID